MALQKELVAAPKAENFEECEDICSSRSDCSNYQYDTTNGYCKMYKNGNHYKLSPNNNIEYISE